MPTTKLKNLIYRVSLPFFAPVPGKDPLLSMEGHHVHTSSCYIHLLQKHHVLGCASIVADRHHSALLLSGSDSPAHIAGKDTYFRVASITKMATSLAVLTLADDCRIDLDQPITDILHDLLSVEGVQQITVRHLLSHTSGIADPPAMDEMLLHHVPLTEIIKNAVTAVPGTSFRYSNLGFGILGCLLEAVTGLSVRDVLKQQVFIPLGMNASIDANDLDYEKIMPVTRIFPYKPGNDLRITPLGSVPLDCPDPLFHYGHTAGSMYTDIDSLFSMLKCIRENGKPLLKQSTCLDMKREHARYGSISPTLSYGLGLLLIHDSRLSDSRIIGHQGFAYGCADGAFIEEDTGRIIITLNGGCSEARSGRLGLCNFDMMKWAFRKELPQWE